MGVGDAGVSSLIFHSFAVTCETVLLRTAEPLSNRKENSTPYTYSTMLKESRWDSVKRP